jgi:ApaG protein
VLSVGSANRFSRSTCGLCVYYAPAVLWCGVLWCCVVSVLYVPEANSNGRYFFTYQCNAEYVADDDKRYRLTTRQWNIRDATGHADAVRGPGVVGLYPEMYRGCPRFTYQSCCPLPTPTGTMGGAFTFERIGTDETVAVRIDPFTFDISQNCV